MADDVFVSNIGQHRSSTRFSLSGETRDVVATVMEFRSGDFTKLCDDSVSRKLSFFLILV